MYKKNREKRRTQRMSASIALQAGRSKGVTRDISACGLFFETDTDYSVGNKVKIALNLDTPWGKVMLRSYGEIVRVESRDHKVGVAVQFIDTKPGRKKRMKA